MMLKPKPLISSQKESSGPSPIKKGNLSEAIRYKVKNEDGSISTVKTISIGTDDGEVVIPTVVNGKVLGYDAAIEHFYKTGENFGTFKTIKEANSYAKALHERHAKELNKGGK